MTGRRLLACAPLLFLTGCAAFDHGILNAAGPVASEQREYLIVIVLVMLLVIGPVLVLTPLIAWYYRIGNKHHAFKPDWNFSWTLEGLIWIPPSLIVIGLAVLLWDRTHQLDPYRPLPSDQAPLEVQVVALDWKWLFLYPGEGVAAVNELAIPANRPIHIRMTSGTVMQSMLIPRLAGQIYAMPGMTTQLNLAAGEPGVYRGQNTQFNGRGFSQGKFTVLALPPAEYDAWLMRVRESGPPLDAAGVERLFQPSTVAKPLLFSSVPPDTFQRVLAHFNTGSQGQVPPAMAGATP